MSASSTSTPTPAAETSATADQKALWGSLLADAIAAYIATEVDHVEADLALFELGEAKKRLSHS